MRIIRRNCDDGDGVMSSWQRTALVSSMLWVISIPPFLMFETNRHASNYLASCIAQAYRTHGDSSSFEDQDQNVLKAAEEQCLQTYKSASFAPPQMLRLLALKEDKKEGVDLWMFMIMPIFFFWTGAWIAIGTIRWLTGIFRRQNVVQRLMSTGPG
jgi:hypothetical protein